MHSAAARHHSAYGNRICLYSEDISGAYNHQYCRLSGGSVQRGLSLATSTFGRNSARSMRDKQYSLCINHSH